MGAGGVDEDCLSWFGCDEKAYKRARWQYLTLFVISTVISWIFRHYADHVLQWTYIEQECNDVPATDTLSAEEQRADCYGKQAVLRVGFATFLFFAIHFVAVLVVQLLSAGELLPVQIVHAGLTPVRFVAWLALVFLTLLTMPASVYEGFFQFARVVAVIYLLIQIVILLESGFKFNLYLVDRDECRCQLVTFTASLFALGIAGIVLLYIHFAPEASCGRNIFFITFTLILSLFTSILSVTSFRTESAGLMTAMLLFAYGTYLCAAALLSAPPDKCTDVPDRGNIDWMTAISFVITLLTLMATCLSTATNHAGFVGAGTVAELKEDAPHELPYNAPFFHFVFACAACFMLMVLTNWSLQSTPSHFEVDKGRGSMWVKIAVQWTTYALYTWILIAPRVLPGRTFG